MAIRQIKVADRNLPEGLYRYKVMEFSEETDPKKGDDLFKLKIATVSVDDGKPRMAWDRFPLSDEMIRKFVTFLLSLGYVRAEDGTIEFDDTALVGNQGYLECTEKEVEKDGKSRTYTNYRYLRPDDEQLQDIAAPEILACKSSSVSNGLNELKERIRQRQQEECSRV
jgi:hypothetical protein